MSRGTVPIVSWGHPNCLVGPFQLSRGTAPIVSWDRHNCLVGPPQLSRGTVPIVTSDSKMLKTPEISTFPIVSWPHPNCHVGQAQMCRGPIPIATWGHPNCHMGPPQLSPEAAPLVKSHTKVRVTVLRTFESNLIARLVGHGVHHVTCGAIQRVSAESLSWMAPNMLSLLPVGRAWEPIGT